MIKILIKILGDGVLDKNRTGLKKKKRKHLVYSYMTNESTHGG
jgi:hypothetical protein